MESPAALDKQAAGLVLHPELARGSVVYEGRGRKHPLHPEATQNSFPASVYIPPSSGVWQEHKAGLPEQEHWRFPPFPSHFFFSSRSHLKDLASLCLS